MHVCNGGCSIAEAITHNALEFGHDMTVLVANGVLGLAVQNTQLLMLPARTAGVVLGAISRRSL